jgi:hypothetical protein
LAGAFCCCCCCCGVAPVPGAVLCVEVGAGASVVGVPGVDGCVLCVGLEVGGAAGEAGRPCCGTSVLTLGGACGDGRGAPGGRVDSRCAGVLGRGAEGEVVCCARETGATLSVTLSSSVSERLL